MQVLLTGATGLVGKEVGKKLVQAGHQVTVVARSAAKARQACAFPCDVIEGDLSQEALRDERFKKIDAVIHLAGESVAEARWSKEKKDKIYRSRANGTQNLIESLREASLKVFVSTSASGYYGDRGSEVLTENSAQGSGYLADVCRDWERPVLLAQSKEQFPVCRFVILRVGVVLSPFGGAMLKMIKPFRMGVGGAVGDGSQWMSWIHIDDLSQLYVHCIESPEYTGLINAVAPDRVTNKNFSESLARSLGKNLLVSVPTAALKAVFGEMSHVLLSSQNIKCEKLMDLQFVFKYPTIQSAFEQIASFYKTGEEVFYAEQYLPYSRNQVFPFFSAVKNLESITPPILHFKVMKTSTVEIQSGTLIDYKLKVHGFPLHWRTEILNWNPPFRFTDTQLKGPYSLWHHTHEFTEMGSGTLMTDLVRYRLPMGLLGQGIAGAFVTSDVNRIFDYRREVCSKLDFTRLQ